jgi:hypothetical protein
MRGRPFEPGNNMGKGRPPGRRNKKTVFLEQLEGRGVDIINQVTLQALKKTPDSMILRSCLERLVPIATVQRNHFHLPSIRLPEDLAKANAAIAQAVARGRISAIEGAELSRILVNQRALFDEDFDRRLKAIEQKQSKPE